MKRNSEITLFFSFVRKEFYHIFRDPRTMLILLIMPIVQIIMFGFAISTEVKNARVAIYDPSNQTITQQIIERLDASEYFTVTSYLQSPRQADELFMRGDIEMALVFGEQFGRFSADAGGDRIQLIADASDPNIAATVTNYATAIIAEQMGGNALINTHVKLLYNPTMKGAYNFVPGVMGLILMMICCMMTSISIVREKERGTMEILLVSPVRPLFVLLSKIVPYFVLSIFNLITILLLSVFLLDVPVAGSIVWLGFLSIMFILASLSMGLLISTMVKTQIAAMLVSAMGLMMPSLLLSGMMFPIENMPQALQWISNVIPAKWYIMAVRKLMIQGVGVEFAAQEMLILLGMTVVLIVISLKKFKIRL